ncbi:hypothetical protein [Sphingobium sp. CAP-1]|uniref:hypothetical protein n=1 Tax=Sphingobium sp. CAP-1 TaxID=2676077 RepID=UPI0012BB3B35|nr:hypothetical protein [Sphingobium sp. CAP-1]QGP78679.1 hypothetical protein GL174_06515 [Sphingobium sp. CAP-1]
MASGDEDADAALEIMRQWQWTRGDSDGGLCPVSMDLNDVANRLAMEGISRPQDLLLSLLCRGDLSASGDYRWRKYQGGNHFQLEGINSPIKQKQWQGLADLIEAERLDIAKGGFGFFPCDLTKLGMKNCAQFDWAFFDNRFSTAICPYGVSEQAAHYLEEWFSAGNIQVHANWLDDYLTFGREPKPVTLATKPIANKGGRPPVADWELTALEIAGRYYRGDFKPQTIADVARELASLLGNQDLHPSDSVVRIHAKRIFEAFKAWEGE